MKPTYLNLNYPKVYTSSKTSGQIEITSKVLQFTEYIQNQVQLYISNTAGKNANHCYPFFCL